jgi:hypothetical protein
LSDDTQSMSNDQLAGEIARVENQISTTGVNANPPPAKQTIFDHSADKKLSSELGAIWDKAEAREERKPVMPSIAGEKLADRVTRAHEWTLMTAAERRLESDASKDVSELKGLAEKYGVSVSEAEQIKQTSLMQSATEFGPAAEHLRSAFKDSSPVESAKFFSDVKRAADQDLPGTVAWMAGQYGMHPLQLAQQIAARYGQQPQQQHQPQGYDPAQLQALDTMIKDFSEKNPRLNDLENEVIEILQTETFANSNQPHLVKLKAALDVAEKRDSAGDLDQKLERSMRRVANRKGVK